MNKFIHGLATFSIVASTFCALCGCDRWKANAASGNIEPLEFYGIPQIRDGSDPAEVPICCVEGPTSCLDAPQSE